MVVLFMVTLIVFFVMRLLPGDPLIIYVAQTAELEAMPPELLDELRKEFGLDKPIMVQYVNWVLGILRGDFGTSIFYREKVSKLLLGRFPVTIHLGVFSFNIGAFFIVPLDPLGPSTPPIRRGLRGTCRPKFNIGNPWKTGTANSDRKEIRVTGRTALKRRNIGVAF